MSVDIDTFQPFPKMPRLKRGVVITEKIDGTNAQVVITDDGRIRAGSRTRWITPGKTTDNYGFATWVEDNREELLKLGPGQHFGEWYGQGIQRGYGLTERRFALFNAQRWHDNNPPPSCCEVVPVLMHGGLRDVESVVSLLRELGSCAVPGYMQPEGIVVWHDAARQYFKVLLENDHLPKGLAA
jgi:hypothetical protein